MDDSLRVILALVNVGAISFWIGYWIGNKSKSNIKVDWNPNISFKDSKMEKQV